MIDSGKLDKRVTLQSASVVHDSYNQPVETWNDVATVWASVEPIRGREYFAARQFSAETTHKVTIRYRTGIGPKMRVVYGSRTFRIEAVIDPKELHESLELMAVEVLS